MPHPLPLLNAISPPAPNYSVLFYIGILILGLLLAMVTWGIIYFYILKKHQHSAKHQALNDLKEILYPAPISELQTILRQTALSYYQREQVAHLHDMQWLMFLDQENAKSKTKHASFVHHHTLWQKALFQPQQITQEEWLHCKKMTVHWITEAMPPSATHTSTISL